MVSGSEDRITCHVLSPVVKGYAPGIGAGVRAESGQAMQFGFPRKPSAILLADGTVWSLDLGVMKDGFPKDQVTVRRPGEVVQSMVRVLATESGQHGFPVIRLAVAIGVFEEAHMRFLGDVHPSVSELEGKGYV